MTHQAKRSAFVIALCLLAFLPAITVSQDQPQKSTAMESQSHTQTKATTVYVCACMKTKSCSCMTMAKAEGPCACGTKGGPPLKAVPSDSAWAKENRDALAK